ncbi:MAG TPA: hypothetical protein VJN01_15580, partial [Xanthomonadales bacterium]|nr:hypothetical protein [Xanthomonadales bacterium]
MANMFSASELNHRNKRIQKLFQVILGGMTLTLMLPVAIILVMLVYKGGPAISFDFLFTTPTNGM